MLWISIETYKKKKLRIYKLPQRQVIGEINSLKVKALCLYLVETNLKIDGVWLEGYKPYMDLIYRLYPKSIICINPSVLKNMLKPENQEPENKETQNQKTGNQEIQDQDKESLIEEAAATLDLKVTTAYKRLNDWQAFIERFYSCQDRQQAIICYKLWQIDMPLNQPKLYKSIRTIEFYYKEVFNYFVCKKALADSK